MKPDNFLLTPIGYIHTPYLDSAPRQPVPDEAGEFYITIRPAYEEGLDQLGKHKFIYILFWLDRQTEPVEMIVTPHHDLAHPVGLFASRTPRRPNPIGLSLVQLKRVEKNILYISGIDALNETPVLDIKPFFPGLDSVPPPIQSPQVGK